MPKRETFQPVASLGAMIPGTAFAPLPGTSIVNVFLTGGCADPAKWIHGAFNGARSFADLEEADLSALCEGGHIVRHRDYYLFIAYGGLFDQTAQAA